MAAPTDNTINPQDIARLERQLQRERRAREEAERLLEVKSAELFDAHEKLLAEAKFTRSLALAVESASDGIAITDETGLFTYMNAAHALMFGYEVGELIGQPWSYLYGSAELERFEQHIMPQFARDGEWRGEATAHAKDGMPVVQDVVLSAIPSGGLICATRDITARKTAQIKAKEMELRLHRAEQEAALFTLGNAVAHDFNNLIAAISGYAMLIQAELSPEQEAHKRAGRIAEAADQAAGVIRSLEVERSNDTTSLDDVDLNGLIKTGVAIAEAIRPPGVRLNTQLPERATVHANEVLLSRCLLNITKNAFDAMGDSGALTIRIADEPRRTFGGKGEAVTLGDPAERYDCVLEISDTGPGIHPQKLAQIFDPFFTTKTKLKGSGLGLLSLASLAESGAAFIEVTSRLGHGTQFRLNFKAPMQSAAVKGADPVDKLLGRMTDAPHILVVEDEAMMADVLVSTLTNLGYIVEMRHDPRKALAYLAATDTRVDLLISDLTMPHMMGDALAKRAHDLRPDMPILIYSGQAGYVPVQPYYTAVLRKPVAPDNLKAVIQAALNQNEEAA